MNKKYLFQNPQESQASWVDYWNLAMCQLGRVGLGPLLQFPLLSQLLWHLCAEKMDESSSWWHLCSTAA